MLPLPLTIMPTLFGALGLFYGVAAAILGARLLWYCVRLLRERYPHKVTHPIKRCRMRREPGRRGPARGRTDSEPCAPIETGRFLLKRAPLPSLK